MSTFLHVALREKRTILLLLLLLLLLLRTMSDACGEFGDGPCWANAGLPPEVANAKDAIPSDAHFASEIIVEGQPEQEESFT